MPLSEEEQRILAEIEASLLASDPDLTKNIVTGEIPAEGRRRVRLAVVGFIVATVAVILLLQVSFVLAFVAFLAAFGALVYVQADIREMVGGHFSRARDDLRAGMRESIRNVNDRRERGDRHGRDAGNPFN